MTGIIDRLPNLVEIEKEDLSILRTNAEDVGKDKSGSASATVANSLRFVGVANYVLSHDIEMFKSYLSEAAEIRKRLFERFERGESISQSYVSMIAYKALFNSLAAGNIELSKSLASHMGGRSEIEKKYDNPFDCALGYALKSFTEDNHTEMLYWTEKISDVCKEKGNIDFQGYAQMFKAMLEGDETLGNKGIQTIIKGHKNQIKGRGLFRNSEDEALCVWGIGITNLARSHGVIIQGVSPLIPDELLI